MTATGLKPTTTKFINKLSTTWSNWSNDLAILWVLNYMVYWLCFYHVICVFRVNLHFVVALMSRNSQGLVYGTWDYTHMPLHMPKTLEMCKKSMPCLIKKLQGVWQIAHLKQQRFLSLTFYKTQRSYKKIVYLFVISLVQWWRFYYVFIFFT